MKLDILAIGVHPDDVELCAAGTIIKHVELGYKVGIVDLTQGELGTRGNAELRMKEALAAAELMGVSARENLGMADGFFSDTRENQMKIIRMIRKYRPEIVLANAIRDRHPDHGRSAELESRSCFLAGLRKIETELDGKPQEAWRPKAVYHYIQDRHIDADFVVDITDYIDRKFEAIKCYASQFYDPDSDEPESPISVKDFLDYVRAKSKTDGRTIGVEYGEGFTVERQIGINNLFDVT
jgi:bacillithiol biosynthesis deacetylase BshB1